jgi:hypothetical protein
MSVCSLCPNYNTFTCKLCHIDKCEECNDKSEHSDFTCLHDSSDCGCSPKVCFDCMNKRYISCDDCHKDCKEEKEDRDCCFECDICEKCDDNSGCNNRCSGVNCLYPCLSDPDNKDRCCKKDLCTYCKEIFLDKVDCKSWKVFQGNQKFCDYYDLCIKCITGQHICSSQCNTCGECIKLNTNRIVDCSCSLCLNCAHYDECYECSKKFCYNCDGHLVHIKDHSVCSECTGYKGVVRLFKKSIISIYMNCSLFDENVAEILNKYN